MDPCVFNRTHNNIQTTITVYVDNLLITSVDVKSIDDVIDILRQRYKELKITRGTLHNYLGMVMDFTKPGSVNISQAGMTQDITKGRPLDAITPYTGTQLRSTKTPAAPYLFDVSDTSDPINSTGQKLIRSIGAKILFLGTHARPDIILSNSFHTKRVLAPTTEDLRKLQRTLSYLEDTPELN